MGLILTGAILVLFYIAKIFFPEFIVGVAEIPSIVKFGNFVQSNKWYLHIFNIISGYVHGHILYCACSRRKFLSLIGNIVLVSQLILLRFISELYPLQYNTLNCALMAIAPFLICLFDKNLRKETFISTMVCFSTEIAFEFLSLAVRNLLLMTTKPNAVTFLVLMVDLLIWRILLYLFFNNKNEIKGGQ